MERGLLALNQDMKPGVILRGVPVLVDYYRTQRQLGTELVLICFVIISDS